MKRLLLLLAATTTALAVVFPATAGAASFRGVVIAKDAARKSVVTASANGTVRTTRLHTGFKRLSIGTRVIVHGSKLPDGTFSAAAVKRLGKARLARVRATVVKRLGARLALSAGGSVFALRIRGGKTGASTGDGFRSGDRLDARTRVRGSGLEAHEGDVEKVGHDGRLELEGIYLATDENGTIELAVVHRGRVFVKVPDGVTVPTFKPGDEIALVVIVEADGSFTLVKAENEDDGGDDGGVEIGKEQFTVAGILATAGPSAVVVNVDGSEERAVRCARPDEFDLTGFETGQKVLMTCRYGDGALVLVALKHLDAPPPPPPGEYLAAQGTLSALDATRVSVEVEGKAEPVSCLVPAGMNLLGFAVGDQVKMYCFRNDDGHYVVKALISDHAAITPDGSWFMFEGAISDLTADHVSLDVAGRDDPVTCSVAPGADLGAFAVGDTVTMKCKLFDDGFRLKLLESETAHYELL